MGNYHQKKGKGKLPLFCCNGERVIPIYDCRNQIRPYPNLTESLPLFMAAVAPKPSFFLTQKNITANREHLVIP